MIRCHEMWCGTTKIFLLLIRLRTLLLICHTTVSRMTLTWHLCGGWVLQKVDISLLILLFLRLFEYDHPLVCLKYWQYWYLNIDVLKTYCSRFLATSVEHLFRRAPFDDCLWQYIEGKSICPFSTNFDQMLTIYNGFFCESI